MSEKELHQQLVKLLNAHMVPHCRARMDRKATIQVGWPDFTFPFRGCFVAWEVKVGKNALSPEQEVCATNIERHGGCYRVIRDMETAERHLQEVGK